MTLKERIDKAVLSRTEYKGKDKDGNEYTVVCGDQSSLTTDILKAFVDHCEDFLGKEDSDEYPGEGEYYNKAIQDIIEDMKERIG